MKAIDTLLAFLFKERGESVPPLAESDKFRVYRSLVNVRPPLPVSDEYRIAESEYLNELLEEKGIVSISDLAFENGIALWRGDITRLAADGIVNAANSALLGCFAPCHACIDNAIHTFAGVDLRLSCDKIMREQGKEEETGKAKITSAFNLPSKYVLHTVGPIVFGELTERHKMLLANCYKSCLTLAEEKGLESLAFCCISTGEFRFPNEEAAKIAIRTVREYLENKGSKMKIVFNVFKEIDYDIYARILGKNQKA